VRTRVEVAHPREATSTFRVRSAETAATTAVVVSAVVSAIAASADTMGDDRCGPDDSCSAGDGPPDHSSSSSSSWA